MIEIRLRVPLFLYRGAEPWTPPTRVPARTTLRIVDVFENGALVVLPGGTKAMVARTTIRDHGYTPRVKAA